jgi:hypothetical protein
LGKRLSFKRASASSRHATPFFSALSIKTFPEEGVSRRGKSQRQTSSSPGIVLSSALVQENAEQTQTTPSVRALIISAYLARSDFHKIVKELIVDQCRDYTRNGAPASPIRPGIMDTLAG